MNSLFTVYWLDHSGNRQSGVTEAPNIMSAIQWGLSPDAIVTGMPCSVSNGMIMGYPVIRIELLLEGDSD